MKRVVACCSLNDTKVAPDWAAAGTIDLATTGIFLGNPFNNDTDAPDEGATWSGTITLPSGFDTVTLTVPQSPDTKKFARLKVTITE